MINSKWIRTLCYIVVGMVCLLALMLIIFGISALADERTISGVIFIITGILAPFIICVSMYPIFALSLIETSTSNIKNHLEHIVYLLESKPKVVAPAQDSPPLTTPQHTPSNISPTQATDENNIDSLEEAIHFINQEYNIDIDVADNLGTIQEKILNTNSLGAKGQIFRKRILAANSLDEVYSAIKIHRTIHG